MKYDFQSLSDRQSSSSKWNGMLQYNPSTPKGIIPLSTADMEFCCPPFIVEAIKEYATSTILGYSYMNKSFISSFIGWMARRHAYNVAPSSLVATSGVVTSLFTAVKSFTKKGDGVLIMPPVYGPFYFAVERCERTLVECPLINKEGHYEMDFESIEEKFRSGRVKAMIFCSPHNPVGRVWKREELERLSALCVQYDIFVIADEIHHDIIMPGFKHTVLEAVNEGMKGRIVTCTSLSKTFNVAGLSLSISIIPNEKNRERFSEELEKIPQHIHNGISYRAYEEAYNNGEEWLSECLDVISDNFRFATNYIKNNIPKVLAYYPEGTYLLWMDFRALNLSDEELERFLKDKAYLFLTQGYVFGKEAGRGFARMNMAAPKFVIEGALQRLKNEIDAL